MFCSLEQTVLEISLLCGVDLEILSKSGIDLERTLAFIVLE
jgi:hypothetical protein